MQLTIDVRKAFDTGIGTYIRQMVPRVARRLPSSRISVVVKRGDVARHSYLDHTDVSFIETDARPLSLTEQWHLRGLTRHDRLFWATSLAQPLLTSGPIVNTVYDLAQLALPAHLGGSLGRRLLARPYFERIRLHSHQILFISDFTAAEFHRLLGKPAGSSTVIPLGVDSSWFGEQPEKAPRPMREPYFVMLGNLRPHKNLALVLRAMQAVSQKLPHRLLLIGPKSASDSGATVGGLLQELSQRVVFAGDLPQTEVLAALQQAEALLFPSHYEGFGLPVLEAMACGCPVLVARNGVSPTLAGENALSFDPANADELAGIMQTLAAMTPVERADRKRAGVARARLFNWDSAAESTADALQRTAERLALPRLRAASE